MNKWVKRALKIALIALLVFLCALLFYKKQYAIVSILLAAGACLPFLMAFEKKQVSAKETVLIAALIAISIAGRALFAPIPFFKPVAAMVILCALYLGPEAGFLIGSMSALLSNILFGQGPWTPFQMFAFGIIGLIAGVFAKAELFKHKLMLFAYGFLSGFVFSAIMDIWTVLSLQQNQFSLSLYLAKMASALPVTLIYAFSNVFFLWVLSPFFDKTLRRVIVKYGIAKN